MAKRVIFYSWQSDLQNSTNRGFIEDCLNRAVESLDVADLEIEPSIDRDTQGVAGSPDIANTIFSKIDNATIFVGDVSLIHPETPDVPEDERTRRTPNPNVLVELGYAAARLSWDRIVLVHNLATGPRETLPFDIRSRRIASYALAAGDDKTEPRKLLIRLLRDALDTILRAADTRAADSVSSFLGELAPILVRILLLGDEGEERSIRPWLDNLQGEYRSLAEQLRNLASSATADVVELGAELEDLAATLDIVGYYRPHIGGGDEFDEGLRAVVEAARTMKEQQIDSHPLSQDTVRHFREELSAAVRYAQGFPARAEALWKDGRFDDIVSQASSFGERLLSIGYYNLDAISAGLSDKVRRIGRELHVLETVEFPLGTGPVEEVLSLIRRSATQLATDVTPLLGASRET